MSRLDVLILAAGLGTRMKSDLVKVLHRVGGRPIIEYVIDVSERLTDSRPIMVIGHQHEAVRNFCAERAEYCIQSEPLGTGHAVMQAEEMLTARGATDGTLLLLSGDVPLIRPETLRRLLAVHTTEGHVVTVLTMELAKPGNYGRILRRPDGSIASIVEARDATDEQKLVREVNAGIYVFAEEFLLEALRGLSSNNVQGEYYLTDVVAAATGRGLGAGAVIIDDPAEVLGVNSRAELAMVDNEFQKRTIARLMADGVTFRDPDSVLVDDGVEIGRDTIVYPFVCLEGRTRIGTNCTIGPGAHLRDTVAGDRVAIRSGTVADGAEIGDDSVVGPHAHLRPGTVLGRSVRIGNFVETKKAIFGDGSKASHLSYIGDAEVGNDVNIGAGTITCNFDGVSKHKTIIEAGVFIGSNSQLVAPVTIGKGAYVGAGSTITKDVPPDSLALTRSPQIIHEGWASKKRGTSSDD